MNHRLIQAAHLTDILLTLVVKLTECLSGVEVSALVSHGAVSGSSQAGGDLVTKV